MIARIDNLKKPAVERPPESPVWDKAEEKPRQVLPRMNADRR